MISKLNLLAQMTQPDISFAIHQCARFVRTPKEIHATAVKQIGRYLKGTVTKGIILCPDETNSLNSFVNFEFAG